MNYRRILCAAVIMGFSMSSVALDKNGKFAIKGIGNASCEKFVEVAGSDDPEKFLFAGWLNGYITAHNQHLKDNFDIISWENIETLGTYVRSHCAKNPTLSFFQATTQLLNEMYESRIVEFVGAENLASGKQALKTYRQVIQRVQKRLKDDGLYTGATDGVMTDSLQQAVNEFRVKNDLPSADYLDQRVLHALLRR